MIYLITYDINSKFTDYNDLYDKIKSLGDWFHPLESVWLLHPNYKIDVNKITDKLRETISDYDHIFVVEITKSPKQGWLPKTAWEWLKKYE